MRRRRYPEMTRLRVVADLLCGSSVREAASNHGIPASTVANWSARKFQAVGEVGSQKRAEIGEILLEHLKERLRAAIVQLSHFQDGVWLGRQDAASLAILHGVEVDKAMRMVRALEGMEKCL